MSINEKQSIQSHRDLYLVIREFVLHNQNLVKSGYLLTPFDDFFKEYAVRVDKSEDIETNCFKNAERIPDLIGALAPLNELAQNFSSSRKPDIINLINMSSDLITLGLRNSFPTFLIQIINKPCVDEDIITDVMEYDRAYIGLYSKLISSLLLRSIYGNITSTDIGSLERRFTESSQHNNIQFVLGRFCISNYEEWIRDYLKDNSYYNNDTESGIKEMVKSPYYRKLIHGFSNASFDL